MTFYFYHGIIFLMGLLSCVLADLKNYTLIPEIHKGWAMDSKTVFMVFRVRRAQLLNQAENNILYMVDVPVFVVAPEIVV